MKIILNNIKVPIEHTKQEIFDAAYEKLKDFGISGSNFCLCRKSLDARRKNNIHYVCAIIADTDLSKEEISEMKNSDIRPFEEVHLDLSEKDDCGKTVVVGTGPCGLFAAYVLAKQGLCPIVLERGADVDKRTAEVNRLWTEGVLNPDTNVQFGEGGAGTFSDGKLTTRIGDPLQRAVLEIFVRFGAPDDILYKAKPHIGTDKLKTVVKNMRKEIIRLGGDVRFNARLTDIIIKNGRVEGIVIGGGEILECKNVILATGHSGRDVYEMLYKKGVALCQKAFSAGVRIEHTQSFINKAQYGSEYENPHLLPADYRLVYNGRDRSCYSFCMCPGGTVVNSASEDGGLVVNGMSEYKRSGQNANSALAVTVNPGDFASDSPLAGIEFQRKYERLAYKLGGGGYAAPIQLAKDFINNKISTGFEDVIPTYTGKTLFAPLRECLPEFISKTLCEGLMSFEHKMQGYASGGAVLTGVEMRTSAPVRILRDENHESVGLKGLYPAGEGAGYAGGIMSAAIDGIKTAQKISLNRN